MFKFQTLKVWEKSVEFANLMIDIADLVPRRYQYSFGEQLRRAGLSIPNNVAEATGRRIGNESKNFFNIAKGSVYECINILVILSKRNLIDWSKFDREKIYSLAEEICKMLSSLIK